MAMDIPDAITFDDTGRPGPAKPEAKNEFSRTVGQRGCDYRSCRLN